MLAAKLYNAEQDVALLSGFNSGQVLGLKPFHNWRHKVANWRTFIVSLSLCDGKKLRKQTANVSLLNSNANSRPTIGFWQLLKYFPVS